MESFMDSLHMQGIALIQYLQSKFTGWDELMLLFSHLGDPRNAFLICFPIAYFCQKSVGKTVMWIAAYSEWLNAILKWMLYGQRPYWWVKETHLYGQPPVLQQFRLTCETGPGSPSGHAMVTSSIWFFMVSAFLATKTNARSFVHFFLWASFILLMVVVCMSRCFIATHFPHQVVAGTITGILLAIVFERFSTKDLDLHHYILGGVFLLVSAMLTFGFLQLLQVDPGWSVALATRWCAHSYWVHLDTTPFAALVRDASALMGLGFALRKVDEKDEDLLPLDEKLLSIALALTLTQMSEVIKLPQHPQLVFYLLYFAKNFLLPYVIVVYIPKVIRLFLRSFIGRDKSRKSA